MPRISLPSLFNKKQLTDEEKELLKYPKKDRERLKKLLDEYNSGNILKIEEYKKKK